MSTQIRRITHGPWKFSGLKQAEFCARRGVSLATFRFTMTGELPHCVRRRRAAL